jgi:hypothetical protein
VEDHEEILFYFRALHGLYYNLSNNNDLKKDSLEAILKPSEGFELER